MLTLTCYHCGAVRFPLAPGTAVDDDLRRTLFAYHLAEESHHRAVELAHWIDTYVVDVGHLHPRADG